MKKDIVTSATAKKTAAKTKKTKKTEGILSKAFTLKKAVGVDPKDIENLAKKESSPKAKKPVKQAVKKVAPVETEIVDGKKPAFEERTWYEFQQGGFLLFINLFLQIFGWSTVMPVGETGLVTNVYPARTGYRGFGPEELSRAYVRVTEFLVKNGKKLLAETKD